MGWLALGLYVVGGIEIYMSRTDILRDYKWHSIALAVLLWPIAVLAALVVPAKYLR